MGSDVPASSRSQRQGLLLTARWCRRVPPDTPYHSGDGRRSALVAEYDIPRGHFRKKVGDVVGGPGSGFGECQVLGK